MGWTPTLTQKSKIYEKTNFKPNRITKEIKCYLKQDTQEIIES